MRKITKYLFVAALAAFTFASCEKEKENKALNPDGTPVKFTFSATETSETEADLKVVSDVPVPADVTIALAPGSANNIPETAFEFPKTLVIQKGQTEVTGKASVNKNGLTPEVSYKAALDASVAGTVFGSASFFSIKLPKPEPVTVDGDASEWSKLPSDYVTELVCAGDAEFNGLKSVKVFYDEKLYVILEITDEVKAKAIEETKLRAHFYFDNGNDAVNGNYGKWSKPAIDYMLEGKLISGGEWCALGSKYYQFTGDDPHGWSGAWTGSDVTPAFTFVGKDNVYECAMDYSTFPGGMNDVIGIGFDIQNNGYETVGLLPSAGTLAQVVKNGKEIPAAPEATITIDGDFSDWKTIESVAGEGALKTLKMKGIDDMMYFYAEVEKTDDYNTNSNFAFAHQLRLCFDNADGAGEKGEGETAWGNARYDKIVEIWLMQNGVPNMINWDLDGFAHKEADGDEIQKYEFCFKKSVDPVFSSEKIVYGGYVNNRTCDNSSGQEVWDGEAAFRIGSAPAVNHPMAYYGAKPSVSIDGDLSEWIAFDGISDGNYGMFKVASDAENIYFYSFRNRGGRFGDLWGVEKGYIYFAFDLDNDPTNGETLNGQGPYDFVGYIFCFGGSNDAPVIEITAAGSALPEPCTVANVKVKGIVDEEGAKLEYSIPRKDLPSIPKTPVTITSWGNKDLTKVQLKATL